MSNSSDVKISNVAAKSVQYAVFTKNIRNLDISNIVLDNEKSLEDVLNQDAELRVAFESALKTVNESNGVSDAQSRLEGNAFVNWFKAQKGLDWFKFLASLFEE